MSKTLKFIGAAGATLFAALPAFAQEAAEAVAEGAAAATAAVAEGKPLQHRAAQLKAERRVRALLEEDWVRQLRNDTLLDAA